ncbi:hypothetical protein ABFG93_17000 [Pseudalkalibacillus hwajinpoensis]|uniref:hypothetical protein n=1 Tax=Guptibacillus hwajinpoensis TaxID=208199 RepID=UPI00325C1EC1
MKKYINAIMIIGMLSVTAGCGAELSKVAENHSNISLFSIENKAEAKTIAVEKLEVEKLSDEFINRIVQDTDDQYQVKNFSSEEEINNHLREVASEDLAKKITTSYFEERDGALYIVPTELFPWMNSDNPYELTQLNEYEYQLVQSNQSDLYGSYTIEIKFLYEDNHWIIKNFTIK